MSPADFAAIRAKLGLTQAALAKHLKLSERRIIAIENGNSVRGVPGPVEVLMRAFEEGYRPKGVK